MCLGLTQFAGDWKEIEARELGVSEMEVVLVEVSDEGSNEQRKEGEMVTPEDTLERAECLAVGPALASREALSARSRRTSSQSSSDDLSSVSRSLSFPPSSSSAAPKENIRRRGGERGSRRTKKTSDGTLAKSPLAQGLNGGDCGSSSPQGLCGRKQQTQRGQANHSSGREQKRKSSRSGSHSGKKGTGQEANASGPGGSCGGSTVPRENSGGRRHSEDFQAQYTLDEYSSAIFGDELSEEWTDIESFSDLDEDDLLLQQEAEEKLYRRHQQVFPSKSLPAHNRERFVLSPDKLKKKDWGGQGGPGTDIAALGFMGDLAPPPETAVVCNPLFMNHKAQDMLSSKKTAWNVPSREDTLVKRLNPLYQNLLLTAILEESRQEWPSVSTKKKLFPLRKKQSLTDLRACTKPDKPEKKTENPLYRKVITNDAYSRLRKDRD